MRARNVFRGPGFLGGGIRLPENFTLTERFDLQIGLTPRTLAEPCPLWRTLSEHQCAVLCPSGLHADSADLLLQSVCRRATDMRMAQLAAQRTFAFPPERSNPKGGPHGPFCFALGTAFRNRRGEDTPPRRGGRSSTPASLERVLSLGRSRDESFCSAHLGRHILTIKCKAC